ncbi:hypothetical protein C0993_011305, partial [Termitomyces sp. T159_Od127]
GCAYWTAPRCTSGGTPPTPQWKGPTTGQVLVRRAQEVVEKAREAEAQGEADGLSKKSLVLLTCQDNKEKGSSKGKCKASLPLSPTEKGKKRVRVMSPAAVTPKVESEEDEEDKACCLAATIEASKAVPGGDNLTGPSRQAKAPQDVGNWQEDLEQKEEAEVRLEAALQYDPRWTSLLAPRVTGEAFEWLGEDLAHPVVPLQLAEFSERMRAWAIQMERILARKREAVKAELMGLRLQYLMLRQSMETLHDYQEDVMQVLEWQEENNVQKGDLLPLRDPSLPFDDD